MSGQYGYLGMYRSRGRPRAPLPTASTPDRPPHSQSVTQHHTYDNVLVTHNPPMAASSNEDFDLWSSGRSSNTSPYQPSSYDVGPDPEHAHHRAMPYPNTGSVQVEWHSCVHASTAATLPTLISASQFGAQHLPGTLTFDSIRNLSQSSLPFDPRRIQEPHLAYDDCGLFPEVPDELPNSPRVSESRYVDPRQLQQSQIELEPWSSINQRHGAFQSEYAEHILQTMSGLTDNSNGEQTDPFSGGQEDTILPGHQAMSATTFDLDIDDIMEDISTSGEVDSGHRTPREAPYGFNQPDDVIPPIGVAFQCRVDRVGTPLGTVAAGMREQTETSFVYLRPGSHVPPGPHDHDQSSLTTGSSPMSVTSVSEPDILRCRVEGCRATFRGDYRKGNLGRHMRLKHRGLPLGRYLCEEPGCANFFNRSDARLKHYRKHHPWLANGPPVLRGSQVGARYRGADVTEDGRT